MADGRERPPGDKPARRPARKGFLLRLSPDLMEELRTWANQDLRSLNAHIEFLLREALRRRRRSRGDESDEETP